MRSTSAASETRPLSSRTAPASAFDDRQRTNSSSNALQTTIALAVKASPRNQPRPRDAGAEQHQEGEQVARAEPMPG